MGGGSKTKPWYMDKENRKKVWKLGNFVRLSISSSLIDEVLKKE